MEGLLQNLAQANITKDDSTCEWREQGQEKTLFVQVGDIVDRGPEALPALQCLQHLQQSAPEHSKVIRLLGNHELWWMEGYYHKRNKTADTKENVEKFVQLLVSDIMDRSVLLSHVEFINGVPIVFVHAGFSPAYYNYLTDDMPDLKNDMPDFKNDTPDLKNDDGDDDDFKRSITTTQGQGQRLTGAGVERITAYTNSILLESVSSCRTFPCQTAFADELFEAGPDRGGKKLGGPLWTDFSTLERADEEGEGPMDFVQVVGHSMAGCYHPKYPGVTPPLGFRDCGRGLVRASRNMRTVCVDGGMYLGARAFLQIDSRGGRMTAHQRYGDEVTVPWETFDLTRATCGQ